MEKIAFNIRLLKAVLVLITTVPGTYYYGTWYLLLRYLVLITTVLRVENQLTC
jgi:hypothetical protein